MRITTHELISLWITLTLDSFTQICIIYIYLYIIICIIYFLLTCSLIDILSLDYQIQKHSLMRCDNIIIQASLIIASNRVLLYYTYICIYFLAHIHIYITYFFIWDLTRHDMTDYLMEILIHTNRALNILKLYNYIEI